MARTVQIVFDEMTTEAIARATDAGLNDLADMFSSTSRVAIWKILFYAVAFSIVVLEQVYDLFRSEVDTTIATKKPHTTRWYAEKAKLFQYGYDLSGETDVYDNTALTEQEVIDSLIVKHAAVVEQDLPNGAYGLRIKVAKQPGADLAALSNDELDAFAEYMARVKDAGTRLLITTGPADNLKLNLRVYYNPLVLNNQGERLDGVSNTPLLDGINSYLRNLPFNGRFNLTELVDAMQAVDGVEDPRIISAQTKYGALNYAEVNDEVIPDSGYLRIYNSVTDLIIEWVAKSLV